MKLLRLNFFFFIIAMNTFAQIHEIKQITNYDYDSKNPSFNTLEYPFIVFESHKDSSIELAISSYDNWSDNFESPIFITNNGSNNRNPIAVVLDGSYQNPNIILWETNINGNTDIAYKEYFLNGFNDYQFSETFFITETSVNERSISFLDDIRYSRKFELVYEREGSILLFTKNDSIETEEVVFPAMDCGCIYSQPTGTNLFYDKNNINGKAIAVVETRLQDSTSKIIYKYRLKYDSTWSEIKTLYDSTNCRNPKFFTSLFENKLQPSISFEAIVEGKSEILYYNFPEEFGYNSHVYEYYPNEGEISNFSSYLAYTGIQWGPAFWSVPNSAKMKRNDSTFILVPDNYSGFNTYELIPVKYPASQHKLGNLGYWGMQEITYTIWEDSSSNNRINLFGKGRYEIVVGVGDNEEVPSEFVLEQNYPNPFNLSTTIQYSIPVAVALNATTTNVTLKIYDILGREVTTLVSKEQSAGNYSVVFDASGLTSGLYFYKLSSGGFISTKKMILIK